MRISNRFLLAIGLLLAVPAVARAIAFHLHLEKSEPADKAALTAAPTDLKFWFSEKVGLPLTKITLTRGKDTIALGPLTQSKDAKAPIVAGITKPIAPGAYAIEWRTMGDDGHVVKGTLGFTLQRATTEPAAR